MTTNRTPERLRSLDVLRGFDMFWIIGGKPVVVGLIALFSVEASDWLGNRLQHPEWHGFEPYDLIFPCFCSSPEYPQFTRSPTAWPKATVGQICIAISFSVD